MTRVAAFLSLVGVVLLVAVIVISPVRRFRVRDTSMQPVLEPGDRLIVRRWARLKPRDLVVFLDPEARRTHLVKRVEALTPSDEVIVSGDNPNVSRDSRHFGPIPSGLVVGRVMYRYLPGARRGRL